MKLLLTSNFPMKGNRAVAEKIHDLQPDSRVLYTAYSKRGERYVDYLKDYGFTHADFMDITKPDALFNPERYSVILLHGGNPFHIKENLHKSCFGHFPSSYGGLIVTVSGSSCALSKKFDLIKGFYPSWKGEDSRGYGMFPKEVLPHSQRYKKHLEEITAYSRKEKIYSIPDGSAVYYQGSAIQLIGDVEILDG